jgi:hypothetical protein
MALLAGNAGIRYMGHMLAVGSRPVCHERVRGNGTC